MDDADLDGERIGVRWRGQRRQQGDRRREKRAQRVETTEAAARALHHPSRGGRGGRAHNLCSERQHPAGQTLFIYACAQARALRPTGPRGPRNSSLQQTSVGDQPSRQGRRLGTGPMRRALRVASGSHVTILRGPIEAFIPGESAAGDSLTRPSWRWAGLTAFRIRSGKPPVRGPLDAGVAPLSKETDAKYDPPLA